MENVLKIFTSEDKQEILSAVKGIILDQVRSDFENNSYYLVNPHAIEDMLSEIMEEIKEEVRVIYREKLIAQMEEKLSKL